MPLPVLTRDRFYESRPPFDWDMYAGEREQVRQILADVRRRGDAAVREHTLRFDGAYLDDFQVPAPDLAAAAERVEQEILHALRDAARNIEAFHLRQAGASWWQEGPGWILGQRRRPLKNVGIYVPGGTAAYPSTVLMAAIPARLAGVEKIYLCTPPDSSGRVPLLTLAAAAEAGVSAVFRVGGVQAVAAMAYGTETIPAVQKIVGPGNLYVTLAKKEVYGRVGIDLLAGPSEVVVVADAGADPSCIAADLLSQAEHDVLARAILVTDSPALAEKVRDELEVQLAALPRKMIAARALREQGAAVVVESLEEAAALVNEIAPEHLELHLADPWPHLEKFENAGAIFVGAHSPEPLGDYWAGSNHILPTGGAARFASPLGVHDFVKWTHLVYYSPQALRRAAPGIEKLARAEGLEAHAQAVSARRSSPDGKDGEAERIPD